MVVVLRAARPSIIAQNQTAYYVSSKYCTGKIDVVKALTTSDGEWRMMAQVLAVHMG